MLIKIGRAIINLCHTIGCDNINYLNTNINYVVGFLKFSYLNMICQTILTSENLFEN